MERIVKIRDGAVCIPIEGVRKQNLWITDHSTKVEYMPLIIDVKWWYNKIYGIHTLVRKPNPITGRMKLTPLKIRDFIGLETEHEYQQRIWEERSRSQ